MRSDPNWTINDAPPVDGTVTAFTTSTSERAVDVALAYAALPAYTAVSACEPAAKVVTNVAVATPAGAAARAPDASSGAPALSATEPSSVVPS